MGQTLKLQYLYFLIFFSFLQYLLTFPQTACNTTLLLCLNLLLLCVGVAPFRGELGARRSFEVLDPGDVIDGSLRVTLSRGESVANLVAKTTSPEQSLQPLRIFTSGERKKIEETSCGFFDNLPAEVVGDKKVFLYNEARRSSFCAALRDLTGFEVLCAFVEPIIVYERRKNSSTSTLVVMGGGVSVVNVDKMMCFYVECLVDEALTLGGKYPLFADDELWTEHAGARLVDESEALMPATIPSDLRAEQVLEMTPFSKASYLLHSEKFKPETLPRVRFLKTAEGETFVNRSLLPLLDSTVRQAVKVASNEISGEQLNRSERQFAADRRYEAYKMNAPKLAKMWEERAAFLKSLKYDPTKDDIDYLNDKDEWYERERLKSARQPMSGIEELLKGTGLELDNGGSNRDDYR